MQLLEALSDEALEAQIEKQYERVKAVGDDYWELVSERMVRAVRRELGPEAGFLYLEPDAATWELGLVAARDRDGALLADWDSIGPLGKRFGVVNDELHEGFLFDYIKRFGAEKASFFDLDTRERLSARKFEERFKTL